MRISQSLMRWQLGLALVVCACGDSGPIVAPNAPTAFIRFVNAMPDTLGVDFHAVDMIENSPYIATNFRDIKQAGYTPVAAGSRHFREFLSNPSAASAGTVTQVLVDTVLALQAGVHYTLIHAGFARAGQTPAAKFIALQDQLPTPSSGQIAVRVINLGAGLGNLDVYASQTSTEPLPAAPVIASTAFVSPTSYVNMPVSATLSFRATTAGGKTVLMTGTAPVGEPAKGGLDPVPGSSIAGSVFTVYLFPSSVPGSRAATFSTPGITVVSDVQLHLP
jgi:hypothetical protein